MTLAVGILGAGRMGRIHCENLLRLNDARLFALCDPYLDQSLLDLPIPHKLKSEEDFFRLPLDAVIIASPSQEHARHVFLAIECGFHILCEKPLDQSLDVHKKIKTCLDEKKLNVQIGFNRRFDPDFNAIATRVAAGAIGRPHYLRITSRDPQVPPLSYLKQSGGMFFDMTIHDFDMARFIMGSDISEIYARGDALINPELRQMGDIDTAIISLKFKNGALGVIDNSRQAVYGYDQRVEVFGSKGALANHHHPETSLVMSNDQGILSEKPLHFFLERYKESYATEVKAFIRSCLQKTQASPSIDDAIKAVMAAEAAEKSLRENLPVVVDARV